MYLLNFSFMIGLAPISIDATSKKVNELLNYLIFVSKNIKDREDLIKEV